MEQIRRKITEELCRLISEDNHEAVKFGNLERYKESRKVVRPNFLADIPEAIVREGPDELTLRAEQAGVSRTFIDTTYVADFKWRPPLVDEDWHAICQAIFQAVEGPEWESMYQQFVHYTKLSMPKNRTRT